MPTPDDASQFGNASSQTETTGVTSATFSHVVGSGDNRALFVLVCLGATVTPSDPADPICTGVTYAGLPLTKVGETDFSVDNTKCLAFMLLQPPSGTDNIVVSYNTTNHAGGVFYTSYSDVHQTVPIADVTTGTKSTGPPSLTVFPYQYVVNGVTVIFPGITVIDGMSAGATAVGSITATGTARTKSSIKTAATPAFVACAAGRIESVAGLITCSWSVGSQTPTHGSTSIGIQVYDVNTSPPGATPYYLTEHNEAFIGGQA